MYSHQKVKGHVYVEIYFCRVSSSWWSTGGGDNRDHNAIAAQCAARFFFKHMPEDAGVVSM